MKILKLKTALLILSILTLTNCSNNDDGSDDITSPNVTYSSTIYDATFFQEGNSDAPNLNWNGDQGSFSIINPISGLTIGTSTGVLNWTKDLPIGKHIVQVLATNSSGQTSSDITINNSLQGVFKGTLNISSTNILDFELEFNADGTLIYNVISATNTEIGTGTWENNGTTIKGILQPASEPQIEFSGTLYTDTTPTFIGNVGTGSNAIPFKVVLI